MKLAIFGATGATGQHLVTQALAAGHVVTALARDPEKLTQKSAQLHLIGGNVLNAQDVAHTIIGQDAVLSALGVRQLGKTDVVSTGTRHIVEAMQRGGVRRLIAITSVGVGDSRAQARTLGVLFNRFLLPILLAQAFADKAQQEQVIQQSNLDWLVVRPASLTNDSMTGSYRTTGAHDLTIQGKIARADVAHFMLQQLSSTRLNCQAVTLSY